MKSNTTLTRAVSLALILTHTSTAFADMRDAFDGPASQATTEPAQNTSLIELARQQAAAQPAAAAAQTPAPTIELGPLTPAAPAAAPQAPAPRSRASITLEQRAESARLRLEFDQDNQPQNQGPLARLAQLFNQDNARSLITSARSAQELEASFRPQARAIAESLAQAFSLREALEGTHSSRLEQAQADLLNEASVSAESFITQRSGTLQRNWATLLFGKYNLAPMLATTAAIALPLQQYFDQFFFDANAMSSLLMTGGVATVLGGAISLGLNRIAAPRVAQTFSAAQARNTALQILGEELRTRGIPAPTIMTENWLRDIAMGQDLLQVSLKYRPEFLLQKFTELNFALAGLSSRAVMEPELEHLTSVFDEMIRDLGEIYRAPRTRSGRLATVSAQARAVALQEWAGPAYDRYMRVSQSAKALLDRNNHSGLTSHHLSELAEALTLESVIDFDRTLVPEVHYTHDNSIHIYINEQVSQNGITPQLRESLTVVRQGMMTPEIRDLLMGLREQGQIVQVVATPRLILEHNGHQAFEMTLTFNEMLNNYKIMHTSEPITFNFNVTPSGADLTNYTSRMQDAIKAFAHSRISTHARAQICSDIITQAEAPALKQRLAELEAEMGHELEVAAPAVLRTRHR